MEQKHYSLSYHTPRDPQKHEWLSQSHLPLNHAAKFSDSVAKAKSSLKKSHEFVEKVPYFIPSSSIQEDLSEIAWLYPSTNITGGTADYPNAGKYGLMANESLHLMSEDIVTCHLSLDPYQLRGNGGKYGEKQMQRTLSVERRRRRRRNRRTRMSVAPVHGECGSE